MLFDGFGGMQKEIIELLPSWANKMVRWVYKLAAKPDDLGLIPRTHMVGENRLVL